MQLIRILLAVFLPPVGCVYDLWLEHYSIDQHCIDFSGLGSRSHSRSLGNLKTRRDR